MLYLLYGLYLLFLYYCPILLRVDSFFIFSFPHTDSKDFKDCYAASGYALIIKRLAGAGPVPVHNPVR